MKKVWLLALSALFAFQTHSQLLPPSDESLVLAFADQRERLVNEKAVNLSEMSSAIIATTRKAIALSNGSQLAPAMEEMRKLQSFMPLKDLPSYEVHNFLAFLYMRLGDQAAEKDHRQRANALRTLLLTKVGTGDSFDDPKRLIMVSEIIDVARTYAGDPAGVKSESRGGREFLVVSLKALGRSQVIVEIDPRSRQQLIAKLDRYASIPKSQLRPEDITSIDDSTKRREAFLADKAIPYLKLVGQVDELMKTSAILDQSNKPAEALEKLRELSKLREIDQIPTPRLWLWYSYLLGRTGQSEGQKSMRGLIFGLQQLIAQGGDARSAASAVEVAFTEEEYDWLREKKLQRVRQRLLDDGPEKFDVLSVRDAQGKEFDVYFKITRMFQMYSQGLADK